VLAPPAPEFSCSDHVPDLQNHFSCPAVPSVWKYSWPVTVQVALFREPVPAVDGIVVAAPWASSVPVKVPR
jgi:hypothetical protein